MVRTRSGRGKEENPSKASGNRPAGVRERNRVSAAKPPKSPELVSPRKKPPIASGAGDDSSLHSGGSVGSGSSTASRPGIPLHIQKQLASDIEAAGGIAAFKPDPRGTEQAVSKLCDERIEVYGARGGKLREKIRKKVWYWRKLHQDGKYAEQVLNRLGVKSAANLKKAAKKSTLSPSSSSDLSDDRDNKKRSAIKVPPGRKQKQQRSPSSSSSSSPASLGSDRAATASHVPASDKNAPPAVIGITAIDRKKSAPIPTSSRTDRNLPASSRPHTAIMPSGRSSPPKPLGCEVIEVNVDCPEANREFLIYPAQNIKGAKNDQEFYYGYFILVQADKRWYKESREVEHYKARVFSTNQVLVMMPAFDYTMLYNQDELKNPAARFPEYAIDAIDHACHEYDKNKTNRQYKHFLLQFPSDHELISSVISTKATEDEYLPISFHPVETPDKKGKRGEERGKMMKKLYASFTVANAAVTAQKRGKVEHKPKESEGARMLDELSDDDDEGMSGGY